MHYQENLFTIESAPKTQIIDNQMFLTLTLKGKPLPLKGYIIDYQYSRKHNFSFFLDKWLFGVNSTLQVLNCQDAQFNRAKYDNYVKNAVKMSLKC